jgi:homoserine kinase
MTLPVGRGVLVKVPATTANLGPGFDTLGLALSLYDELTVTVREGAGATVHVIGVGEGEVPLDDTNLVVRAISHTFTALGQTMPGLDLVARNVIPHGRGLGSSGAAIVSGIMAAKGLLEGVVDIDSAVHRGVSPLVVVPETTMSTALARSLQPTSVPHEDAIFNVSRSALLIAALIQSPELLFVATEDKLHQAYRAAAMPQTDELLQVLRSRGLPAVVSGAGPSILVLASDPAQRLVAADLIKSTMTLPWQTLMLAVDFKGATVVPHPVEALA